MDDLTCRVMRVRQEQRRDAHIVNHLFEPVDIEVVRVLGLEHGRNRDESFEGGQELIVRGVLGDGVGDKDIAYDSCDTSEARSSSELTESARGMWAQVL